MGDFLVDDELIVAAFFESGEVSVLLSTASATTARAANAAFAGLAVEVAIADNGFKLGKKLWWRNRHSQEILASSPFMFSLPFLGVDISDATSTSSSSLYPFGLSTWRWMVGTTGFARGTVFPLSRTSGSRWATLHVPFSGCTGDCGCTRFPLSSMYHHSHRDAGMSRKLIQYGGPLSAPGSRDGISEGFCSVQIYGPSPSISCTG